MIELIVCAGGRIPCAVSKYPYIALCIPDGIRQRHRQRHTSYAVPPSMSNRFEPCGHPCEIEGYLDARLVTCDRSRPIGGFIISNAGWERSPAVKIGPN